MKMALIIIGIIVVAVIAYLIYNSAYKPMSTSSTSTTPEATNQVSIVNFSFNPNNISVAVGQEVTFTNNASSDHTVTADDNSFDSGNLAKGQSYKHVFDKAGTYTYHCSIHSSMKGTVVVQ